MDRLKSGSIILLFTTLTYLFLWILFGSAVLPGSSFFSLLVMFVVGSVCGVICSWIGIPESLGSLVAGVLVANLFSLEVHPRVAADIRLVALAIIMLRSGMGLELHKLKHLALMTSMLTVIPSLAENVAAALLASYFFALPWSWCFLIGFGLSAVSPAIVVPLVLHLKSLGYGVDKGIPSLLLAAGGLDNVISVAGFTILASIVVSAGQSNPVLVGFIAPIEIITGAAIGLIIGYMCIWLLRFSEHLRGQMSVYSLFILLICCCFVIGSSRLTYQGAGVLATMVIGCFIVTKDPEQHVQINRDMKMVWDYAGQTLLFVLVGSTVIFSKLDSRTVAFGSVIILIAVTLRCIVAYSVVTLSDLNRKERLFISISWLPKASSQAALASLVLDLLRASPDSPSQENETRGYLILTVLVLSIVITAPIGSVAIKYFGPRLLTRTVQDEELSDVTTLSPVEKHDASFRKLEIDIEDNSNLRLEG